MDAGFCGSTLDSEGLDRYGGKVEISNRLLEVGNRSEMFIRDFPPGSVVGGLLLGGLLLEGFV